MLSFLKQSTEEEDFTNVSLENTDDASVANPHIPRPLTAFRSMDHAHRTPALPSIGETEEAASETSLPSPTISLWSDLMSPSNLSAFKRRASTGGDTPRSQRSSFQDFFFPTTCLGSPNANEEVLLPPPQKKTSKWDIVRKHVRSGHFLVHRNRSEDEHDQPHHAPSPQTSPRHRRVLQAYQQIHNRIHFSPAQCMILILCYVALSVIVFSFLMKRWTIIDSCYFAVVTFSTNGYGDLLPRTDVERSFICIYVLSGVSFVAVALGMLGSNLIEAHDQIVAQAKKINQYRAMSLFPPSNKSNSSAFSIPTGDANNNKTSITQQTTEEHLLAEDPWYKNKGTIINICVAFLICILGYLIGEDQGWDLKTTIYWGIITASTVGFGDFVPESQYSRLLAVFFIPLAAVSMGRCIQLVAKSIINRRRYHSIQKFCNNKELSLRDLEVMDHNNDGVVAWSDFLEFMLLAMQRVDQNMLDELRKQFDRLDVDKSGTLDKQDLVELAKRELQSPRRKLQLALYKKTLLSKGLSSEKMGISGSLDINATEVILMDLPPIS